MASTGRGNKQLQEVSMGGSIALALDVEMKLSY